jgi:hypothetical protein
VIQPCGRSFTSRSPNTRYDDNWLSAAPFDFVTALERVPCLRGSMSARDELCLSENASFLAAMHVGTVIPVALFSHVSP